MTWRAEIEAHPPGQQLALALSVIEALTAALDEPPTLDQLRRMQLRPSSTRLEAYFDAARRGLTRSEAAKELGVSYAAVTHMERTHADLKFRQAVRERISDDDVRAAVSEGLTATDAAEKFGVSRHTVRNRAWRLGLRFRSAPRRRKVSEDVVRDMIERGVGRAEACEKLGVCPSTLTNISRKLGLKWPYAQRSVVSDSQVRRAIKAGLTQGEAAEKFGVSASWLVQIARRLRLKWSPARQWEVSKEEIRRAIAAGVTRAEAAERFGVSAGKLTYYARRLDLRWPSNKGERRAMLPVPVDQSLERAKAAAPGVHVISAVFAPGVHPSPKVEEVLGSVMRKHVEAELSAFNRRMRAAA